MRDVENYLGKKAYTATAATAADLTGGKGNFDFGEKGGLGLFPDTYIKCHFEVSEMTADDKLVVTVKDSADGTTWTTKTTAEVSGVYVAGDAVRIKLPADHQRYMKVMTGYTSSAGHACTPEFYLERG